MATLFGGAVFVGIVFFVFGGMNAVIKLLKPQRDTSNLRLKPIPQAAADYANNMKRLAVPTMIGGALLAVIGGIGLLAIRWW